MRMLEPGPIYVLGYTAKGPTEAPNPMEVQRNILMLEEADFKYLRMDEPAKDTCGVPGTSRTG